MSEFKPTKGEWKISKGEVCYKSKEDDQSYGMLCPLDIGDEANMELIADAGNTYHATGMTPSQLADQRDELISRLNLIFHMCSMHGDFRNGVTDPTGAIDEGDVVAGEVFDETFRYLNQIDPKAIANATKGE